MHSDSNKNDEFDSMIQTLLQIESVPGLTKAEKKNAQLRIMSQVDRQTSRKEFVDFAMVHQDSIRQVRRLIKDSDSCVRKKQTFEIFMELICSMDHTGRCDTSVEKLSQELDTHVNSIREALRWLVKQNIIYLPLDGKKQAKFSDMRMDGKFQNQENIYYGKSEELKKQFSSKYDLIYVCDSIARKRPNYQYVERKQANEISKHFEPGNDLFGVAPEGSRLSGYGIEKNHKKALRKVHKKHFATPPNFENPYISNVADTVIKHANLEC